MIEMQACETRAEYMSNVPPYCKINQVMGQPMKYTAYEEILMINGIEIMGRLIFHVFVYTLNPSDNVCSPSEVVIFDMIREQYSFPSLFKRSRFLLL